MSAAIFVLAINLFVAGLFAAAFGIVAVYQRSALSARWMALAYGMGMVNVLLEFVLPYQQDHRLVSFAIFTAFLGALAACVIGLAYHYQRRRPWLALAALLAGSMLTNLLILDMPRDSFLRAMLYQTPYTLMQALALVILLGHRHWRALDLTLMALLIVSSLHFLGKPVLAALIGSGAMPQAYLSSTYAAYSQSLGTILLVTNGLVILLIIVRDMLADITARSETDPLSLLLNRRGFEDRGDKALTLAARAGVPAVMIVADLDQFKSINDRFGHAMGDKVITAFAGILRDTAAPRSLVGRLGGEEFAVFIPGANLMTGRLYAETARSAFTSLSPAMTGLPGTVSASFGIAALRPGDTLSNLMRRADIALYRAKSEGRNRVCLSRDEIAPQAFMLGKADAFLR
ncbi:GGDEF domain-containing protein [Devosia sp. YIM 151766]|uniref:GGDEF domain-containing protein n=1 Tax=Devosia sp. YIM 151766 TaxID=3017325 RepID=UPI00255D0951|nr:GGDEF domain-containing protein [Devosia sp. YIM 151766]WIY52695.1 GGDEF domain-containing protein [Devosia sp. YIM 151766]